MEWTKAQVEILIENGVFNKKALSKELSISRPTLDKKLKGQIVWKQIEINWLNHLYNEFCNKV